MTRSSSGRERQKRVDRGAPLHSVAVKTWPLIVTRGGTYV